jgi:hypothetical protein
MTRNAASGPLIRHASAVFVGAENLLGAPPLGGVRRRSGVVSQCPVLGPDEGAGTGVGAGPGVGEGPGVGAGPGVGTGPGVGEGPGVGVGAGVWRGTSSLPAACRGRASAIVGTPATKAAAAINHCHRLIDLFSLFVLWKSALPRPREPARVAFTVVSFPRTRLRLRLRLRFALCHFPRLASLVPTHMHDASPIRVGIQNGHGGRRPSTPVHGPVGTPLCPARYPGKPQSPLAAGALVAAPLAHGNLRDLWKRVR